MSYNRRPQKRYQKRYNPVEKRVRAYAPAIKQLSRDVAYMGSLINSEPHYHTQTDSNNFNWLGTVRTLSAISTGDSSQTRTGNRILPRYLTIKGYVSTTSATTRTDPINLRVIVFRFWGEDSSGIPAVTSADVLAAVGNQYAPLQTLNDNVTGPKGDRQRRIEVLKSVSVLVDNIGGSPGEQFDCNIQVNGPNSATKEHIQYQSTAASEPISGGFYILFISDDATSTEVHYKFHSKLTFYDN